ncbi:MAG TPA: S8 family serine peptidase, partial [Longimicrobiaceae bacterium]|nr:S8 family serine peptidase [Longimicrobiaceae bacterium]
MRVLQPRNFWRTAAAAVCTLLAACDGGGLPADVLSPEFQAPLLAAGPDPIPDRYIVVLNQSTPNAAAVATQLVRAHGGALHFTYENAIKGFATTMPPQAMEALRRNPDVSYVVPDGRVQATVTQTNAPWGLDRIDQRNPTLNTTYTYERTGAGVTAYV